MKKEWRVRFHVLGRDRAISLARLRIGQGLNIGMLRADAPSNAPHPTSLLDRFLKIPSLTQHQSQIHLDNQS